MKRLGDAMNFRGLTGRPASTTALRAALGMGTVTSLTQVMRHAGPYVPFRDGWPFPNAGESFTLADAHVLRGIVQSQVDALVNVGVETVRAALLAWSISLPVTGPTGLPEAVVSLVVDQIRDPIRSAVNGLIDASFSSIPGVFGRCGGFAFAAYDFFLAGWPTLPSSWPVHPVRWIDSRAATNPPGSGPLRDYIFRRLVDSLDANALTFLSWQMELDVLPVISVTASALVGAALGSVGGPIGSAIGGAIAGAKDLFGLGGPKALLEHTREHLQTLAAHLSTEAAWPLGIVHGDQGDPTQQHQVLAIGLRSQDVNHTLLCIADENWVDRKDPSPRLLEVDASGKELFVYPSDGASEYTTIKGLICESYSPVLPPETLRWSLTKPDVWIPPPPAWQPTDCH